MRALARPLLLLVGCLLAACGGSAGGSSRPSTQTGAATVAATTSAGTAATTTAALPAPPAASDLEGAGATPIDELGQPDWLAVAGKYAWAAGVGAGIGRLDRVTGKLRGVVPVPGEVCLAMDVGFHAVWAGSCGSQPTVLRIDPASGKTTAAIPIHASDLAAESSIAAGAGGVWLLTADGKLVKIDPTSNRVVSTTTAPIGAAAIRAGMGGLWVTLANTNQLARLSPSDGSVQITAPTGAVPRFLAVGEGAVWVLNQGDGTVTRYDPAANRVVATIAVDTGPVEGGDIAVGGGAVWARVTNALVAQIDPATNRVVAVYGPPHGSGSVAADAGTLWVSAHDVNTVWRLARR